MATPPGILSAASIGTFDSRTHFFFFLSIASIRKYTTPQTTTITAKVTANAIQLILHRFIYRNRNEKAKPHQSFPSILYTGFIHKPFFLWVLNVFSMLHFSRRLQLFPIGEFSLLLIINEAHGNKNQHVLYDQKTSHLLY